MTPDQRKAFFDEKIKRILFPDMFKNQDKAKSSKVKLCKMMKNDKRNNK